MCKNVDFVYCPECGAVNAAQWNPRGARSYDVTCSVCGFEHEHGHYESFRNLTFEQFINESMQAQRIEDVEEFDADVYGNKDISGDLGYEDYHENAHVPGYYIDAMSRDNPTNEDPY